MRWLRNWWKRRRQAAMATACPTWAAWAAWTCNCCGRKQRERARKGPFLLVLDIIRAFQKRGPLFLLRRASRHGQVAQLVEQRTENPCVGGSIPPLATTTSTTYRLPLRRLCRICVDKPIQELRSMRE